MGRTVATGHRGHGGTRCWPGCRRRLLHRHGRGRDLRSQDGRSVGLAHVPDRTGRCRWGGRWRRGTGGTGAPGAGLGADGDFYIDTAADAIYGPKTGGAWGSPTSLIGPAGADGADGGDGAPGARGHQVLAWVPTATSTSTRPRTRSTVPRRAERGARPRP